MGKGIGFGKVIFFNEHFVVYGVPGIVSAIDSAAHAQVRKTRDGIAVIDERKGAKGYAEKKKAQQKNSIERMLKAMGLNPKSVSLKIWLGGNLPSFSGIGASAASSVAIARAIAEELNLHLSNERVNHIAYEAEKAYAGTPSGIDNTAATYGGLLWFKKAQRGKPNTIERLEIEKPVEIVIGNTGIVANTKEMVAGVAARRKNNPGKYNQLCSKAKELALAAKESLKAFNLRKVGELMNQSHLLLKEIEVSCEELDYLVNLARRQGAFGAKLTGGGGGGCIVALTPGRALQEKVGDAIANEGFQMLKARIGIQSRSGAC